MAELQTTIDNLDFDDDDDYAVEDQHYDNDDNVEDESQFNLNPDEKTLVLNFNGEIKNDDKTVINSLLKHYGINDPSNISFEEENGEISSKNWDDLSFDEKMNILKTSYEQPEKDLDDNEIDFINNLRKSNLTPEQYINSIKQQAIQEYSNNVPETPQYKIDDLSDEEIFILDLQDRIEDITNEEIEAQLNKAKEDETFFKKQVTGIRNALKQQEDAYLQEQQLQQEQIREQQFNAFRDSVGNSISKFDRIGNLDLNLDDDDRDNIMSFILDTDETGMSTLGKALNDPDMLVKLSWFALHGNEAFETIQSYFANEIKKANESGYQRGLNDGRSKSKVVFTKPIGTSNVKSIDDIYG